MQREEEMEMEKNIKKYAIDAKGNQYGCGKLNGFRLRHKDEKGDYVVIIQCDNNDDNIQITVPLWRAGWSLEDLVMELADVMKDDLDCIYMLSAKDEVNYLFVPEQALVLGGKRK